MDGSGWSWMFSNCEDMGIPLRNEWWFELQYPCQSTSSQNFALNGLSLDLTLGSSVIAGSPRPPAHAWSLQQNSSNIADFPCDDDEVAIISSRDFLLATSERGKKRPARILTERAGETPLCASCKTRRPDGCQLPCESETSNKVNNIPNPSSAQPRSAPEEPILSCPICLSNLIDPVATKCGHIFCKECLTKSLKTLKSQCPTCRQKVGRRSIFRVYLPTTR